MGHVLSPQIAELQSPKLRLEDQLMDKTGERDRLANRLVGMDSDIAGFKFDKIPDIHQVVLPNFDINNFEQPVDRVDRCTTCHVGIDKAGFEDMEPPLNTHPDRELFLGKHPVAQYGCTPCHDGQGVAVNSEGQAHGKVQFWLQPLLEEEQMESRCLDCHREIAELKGAETLRKGEQLFEQLGCHGCHLVNGYEELEPVGPSLRSIAAKADPQWLVDWIKDPHEFRPRSKMPFFYFNDFLI